MLRRLAPLLFLLACEHHDTPPPPPPRRPPPPVVRDAGAPPRACDPEARCPTATPAHVDLAGIAQWRRIQQIAALPSEAIDLAEVSALLSQAADATVDVAATLHRLDDMADEVRRATPARCVDACRVRLLTRYIFDVWGFHAAGDPNELYNDPELDLLDRVLARREGYCEGLSLLYLALGRRLGIPLVGVLARQHIYVRYTGDGGPLDLDATRHGAAPLRERGPARCEAAPGVYGDPLDARAMVAHLVSVVGIMDALPARRDWIDGAVRMAPRDPDLRNNRGVERERWYDLAGALEDYREAAALDPCVSFYRTNVASVLRRMGRVDEARVELDALADRVARGESDDDPVYRAIARGDLELEQGHDGESERWYRRALAASHNAPVAWEARAVARIARGDAEGAGVDLLAALENTPRAETRLWLVEALLMGDGRGARVELDRALRDGATEEDVAWWRAAVALAEGDLGDAERRARGCMTAYGVRCTRALTVLGDVAERRGDAVCARRYREAFLGCAHPPRDRYRRRVDDAVRAKLSVPSGRVSD